MKKQTSFMEYGHSPEVFKTGDLVTSNEDGNIYMVTYVYKWEEGNLHKIGGRIICSDHSDEIGSFSTFLRENVKPFYGEITISSTP